MCEICLHTPCLSQCPNYISEKSEYVCDICKKSIFSGEWCICNDNSYAHEECFTNNKEIIEWLGAELKLIDY